MKKAIVFLALMAPSVGVADPISKAEKQTLLNTVMNDVMLRGAIAQGRKGGTCEGSVISATDKVPSGVKVEVKIECSNKADADDGGGIFLTIDVKGTVFGKVLGDSIITVEKGG